MVVGIVAAAVLWKWWDVVVLVVAVVVVVMVVVMVAAVLMVAAAVFCIACVLGQPLSFPPPGCVSLGLATALLRHYPRQALPF